jgi:hypothetical protein
MTLFGLEVQPWTVYVSVAILGIFTGIGAAIGSAIVEIWIKPLILMKIKTHSENLLTKKEAKMEKEHQELKTEIQ